MAIDRGGVVLATGSASASGGDEMKSRSSALHDARAGPAASPKFLHREKREARLGNGSVNGLPQAEAGREDYLRAGGAQSSACSCCAAYQKTRNALLLAILDAAYPARHTRAADALALPVRYTIQQCSAPAIAVCW